MRRLKLALCELHRDIYESKIDKIVNYTTLLVFFLILILMCEFTILVDIICIHTVD
jgi:hypothetical protein